MTILYLCMSIHFFPRPRPSHVPMTPPAFPSTSSQVLQSGVADRSEQVAPPTGHAQPHSRSKGRPRKTASRRSSAAGELQQQVLIDGHFEVPVEEEVPSVVSIALHSSSSLSSTTDRETAASDPHSSTIVGVASSVSTRTPSDVGVAPPASCLPVVLIPWVDQDEAASKSALLTALNAAGVSHTSGEGSHGTGIVPVHDTGISPVRGTDEGAVSPRPSKAVPSETSATRLAPLPAKLAASEDNERVEPSPSPPAAAHRALPDPTSVGSGEGTGVEATGHEKERDRSGEGGQRSRKSRRRDSPTASPQTRQSARKSTPLKSVTSLKDTSPSSPRLRARPGSEGLPSESKLKGARRDASLSLPPAKRTRRAVAAAAGNSGQDGARLAQEVMSPERKGAESGTRGPMAWSVAEVAEFVSSVPNCGYMEEVFRSHVSRERERERERRGERGRGREREKEMPHTSTFSHVQYFTDSLNIMKKSFLWMFLPCVYKRLDALLVVLLRGSIQVYMQSPVSGRQNGRLERNPRNTQE